MNEQALTTDAEAPLYEVRKRAGLTNRADIEGLTQDQMREKIIQERRIELAFEGDRWFDLVLPERQLCSEIPSLYRKNQCGGKTFVNAYTVERD